MSSDGLIFEDKLPDTQEQQVTVELPVRQCAVAFVKDKTPAAGFVIITPEAARTLAEHHILVFMQRGFSDGSPYTDMDYADAGVRFEDDLFRLAEAAKLLVKFSPFTADEIAGMKEGQILFSNWAAADIDADMVRRMNDKCITAMAMCQIRDDKDVSITERILSETLSPKALGIAFSAFLIPWIECIVFSNSLKFTLQKEPALLPGVYAFAGCLCSKEIAERLHLPRKSVVSLCWDMN
jgi:hypothetical protein